MAEKKIATERVFTHDAYGREVLAAAPGQEIAEGVEIVEPTAAPDSPSKNNSGAEDTATANQLHIAKRVGRLRDGNAGGGDASGRAQMEREQGIVDKDDPHVQHQERLAAAQKSGGGRGRGRRSQSSGSGEE